MDGTYCLDLYVSGKYSQICQRGALDTVRGITKVDCDTLDEEGIPLFLATACAFCLSV